jgi:hypothetical protein
MRSVGQDTQALRLLNQSAELHGQSFGIIGGHEYRRTVPILAKTRNIPDHERAAREASLEDGETERLIARWQYINGCAPQPVAQSTCP